MKLFFCKEKSSDYIFKVQEQFIVQWMKKENEDYKKIVNILNEISTNSK